MFSKLALFVASAFALGTLAAPGAPAPAPTISQCNVGTVHCCNSIQDAKSGLAQGLLSAVGAQVGQVTGQVGVTCPAVGVIGAGGNSCTAQPVCCTGNNFSGIVVVGCSPININA